MHPKISFLFFQEKQATTRKMFTSVSTNDASMRGAPIGIVGNVHSTGINLSIYILTKYCSGCMHGTTPTLAKGT